MALGAADEQAACLDDLLAVLLHASLDAGEEGLDADVSACRTELELLQEAGFHPLEVIRSATMWGAEAISAPRGTKPEFGIIRPGMLADLVIVDQNPIENLKVLYGTGWIHVNDTTGSAERIGGIKYVMKDGILYDAKKLLRDVEVMVQQAKAAEAKQ